VKSSGPAGSPIRYTPSRDTQAARREAALPHRPRPFEAEPFEAEASGPGDHDPLPFDVASIAELDHVCILLACSRTNADGPRPQRSSTPSSRKIRAMASELRA